MSNDLPPGWRMALLDEPEPVGIMRSICPVCGRPRQIYRGTRLPCHAACLFSHELQDSLWAENATVAEQARRLQVPRSVIMASLAQVRKRRRLAEQRANG